MGVARTPASLREAKPHATISKFPQLPGVLEELEPRATS